MKDNTAKISFQYFIPALFLLFFCLPVIITGCSLLQETEPVSKTAYALNTVITITVYELDSNLFLSKKEVQEHKEELTAGAVSLCDELEEKFSKTIEGTEIWNLNHSDGKWIELSKDTFNLLKEALYYCELTDGKIDLTIAPVKDLWDFTGENGLPEEKKLEAALTHVNYKALELDSTNLSARLTDSESSVDLGFIAKGYIADLLKEYLQENGVTSAVINLGGNVLTIGSKPDGSAFQIGIQKPFDEHGSYLTKVNTSDGSVVTSGIYERYFASNDNIYHHILDTATGYPVDNSLLSVTILSHSSTDGDGLSTTCLILGFEKAKNLIESLDDVEAVFVMKDYKIYDTRTN